jgi:zinc/manganese transport system permease protein
MPEIELSIVVPALLAGLLVCATHVPLGIVVLRRGIVFIDIAIAQIAGVGVVAADFAGWSETGYLVQAAALGAALAGALFLTWTERRWSKIQEGIIGSVFVLAATAQVLLLAGNPHGGEYLKDMLVGQILWVSYAQLAIIAPLSVLVCAAWFWIGAERLGRLGFYLLFGLSVTASVQVVGIYLVFSTLIIPALASRNASRQLASAYAVGGIGYLAGIVASTLSDLPTGALIVWTMAATGIAVASLQPARRSDPPPANRAATSRLATEPDPG